MDFVHSGPGRAGFYRNSKCALAEAEMIKHNAANGPKRPKESPQESRERMEQALRSQKKAPEHDEGS